MEVDVQPIDIVTSRGGNAAEHRRVTRHMATKQQLRGHRVTYPAAGATASGLFTGQETGGEAPLVEPFGFGWG